MLHYLRLCACKGVFALSHLSRQNHILVVDDDEIMRDLLHALLPTEGYAVTSATSGEEALQLLRASNAFDVVLTDIQLPGLAGERLAESLRTALPSGSLLLGMSGSQPPAATQKCFDGFLLKPFDIQLLRHAMETARAQKTASNQGKGAQENDVAEAVIAPLDAKIFGSLFSMISGPQLRELFAMALKDIEKRHKRIVEAALQDDLATAQREAHAVKGSCGMIGAAELQSLAAAIESGTTLDTSAIEEIPRACLRLERMLDSQLHTV